MDLKRALTLRTVVSTSAGLTFATSTFIAAAQMAQSVAGDSAWLAVLLAGLLALTAAASFAEMNGMYPSAAAIRVYLHRGFGERLSLIVSFLYIGVIVAVLGAEAFILSQAIEFLVPAVPSIVWNVALLLIVTLVNLRGVETAGRFQDVVTYGVVASLLVLSVAALTRPGVELVRPFSPGSFTGLLNAAALGVFLFIGFEWVTPLSEEVTQARLVPVGMAIAIGLLCLVYALVTVAMTTTVGKGALAGSPVPQMLFGQRLLGVGGAAWMLAVSLGASATTFNAGFTAGSRFLYAAAREAVLPKWFARVNPRFLTPQNAVLALSLVTLASTVAVYFTRKYVLLVDLGAAMESIVYVLVALAVIRLRRLEPDAPRPVRAPFVPWLPAFTAAAFAVLALGALADDPWAPVVLAAGAAGIAAYVARVVPKLRAQAQAERAARVGRRRRPASGRGEGAGPQEDG
ncbi:MAG: APC family permease [Firmicutes bacterium]|nr:APC family permease [Bacillota bacterium]